MSDFANVTREWDRPFTDDEPGPLYEYIVGPEPLVDSWFDEGCGD